jgi:hypothetical protein
VHRMSFGLAVVFLTLSAAAAQTPETAPAAPSFPAAVPSQSDCSGFIAGSALSRDLIVAGGEDNSFRSPIRQFVEGDTIFIANHQGADLAAGAEFNVVRPANDLFLTTQYSGERWGMRKLGKPYENVGRVTIVPVNPGNAVGQVTSVTGTATLTHANPQKVVARVTFSCGSIVPGDLLVPFQAAPIPEYTASQPLDPFTPLDSSKLHGMITASHDNLGYAGAQMMIYLNLGEKSGVKAGQRFRIYKLLPPHATGYLYEAPVPPETIGEAVVLSVRSKSCVAMIVASYREISAGDYVEAE